MRKRNYDWRQGFTLIEVLLGMSIFSVMALSLYMTFAHGIRISRRVDNFENLYRETRWAVDALALDIENMVPYSYPRSQGAGTVHETIVREATSENVDLLLRSSDEEDPSAVEQTGRLAFRGDQTSLTLMSAGKDGLKGVRYFLQEPSPDFIHSITIGQSHDRNHPVIVNSVEDSRIVFLLREEVPFADVIVDEDWADREDRNVRILSRHIIKGSLKFFYGLREGGGQYQPSPDAEVSWQESWAESYFPVGLRVEFEMAGPDEASQPLKIVKNIMIPRAAWGVQKFE